MSVFQSEISWNEIKKIVEEKIGGGLKVQGDGEVVYLTGDQLAAIDIHDGSEAYYGTLNINSFHEYNVLLSLYDSTSTQKVTLAITAPTNDLPATIQNIIFSSAVGVDPGPGYLSFIGYKLTLA